MYQNKTNNKLCAYFLGVYRSLILIRGRMCRWTGSQHWLKHDDVIKWNHFSRYWPFVRGIHQSPANSPHKGQWRGAVMFSLICAWINGWVNNREAGDLRRHRSHYDVTVMDEPGVSIDWIDSLPPPSWSESHNQTTGELCYLNLVKCQLVYSTFHELFARFAALLCFVVFW